MKYPVDIEKADKYGYETNFVVSHPFKKDVTLKVFGGNHKNKTLVFSTHHQALLTLADRVLIVNDGEVRDA